MDEFNLQERIKYLPKPMQEQAIANEEINKILREIKRKQEHFFPGLPKVNIQVGYREAYEVSDIAEDYKYITPDINAHFSPLHSNGAGQPIGVISLNPRFVTSLTQQDLENTIKHELVHAWLHWKGYSSSTAEGHNDWFLWKAHQIGLDKDCELLVEKYPYMKPVWKKIQKGWKPSRSIVVTNFKKREPWFFWAIIVFVALILFAVLTENVIPYLRGR